MALTTWKHEARNEQGYQETPCCGTCEHSGPADEETNPLAICKLGGFAVNGWGLCTKFAPHDAEGMDLLVFCQQRGDDATTVDKS